MLANFVLLSGIFLKTQAHAQARAWQARAQACAWEAHTWVPDQARAWARAPEQAAQPLMAHLGRITVSMARMNTLYFYKI